MAEFKCISLAFTIFSSESMYRLFCSVIRVRSTD
jgi:hypothetical protein